MAKEGGVVLLALDDDKPVGFAFGFPGVMTGSRFKLASHQAGVLPAYQDRGLGYRIKLAQREAALARGMELITWTFDPLQGRNAAFNLRKLGAVCNTYFSNLYGDMADELNQGLPSDRFRVDWWIASDYVARRLAGGAPEPELSWLECPLLNPATQSEQGLLVPPESFDLPTTPYCWVEIPANLARLKAEAPAAALRWRLQTREIFETAFKTGYTAVNLLHQEGRNYYILQKNWQL
jgi:predicted GNAT superfamily acetyltransferase